MNLSIHPRNYPRGNGEKLNTSKPPNPNKGQKHLRKASARLNMRRVAHERTLASLKSSVVPPSAFAQPGSMKRKGK